MSYCAVCDGNFFRGQDVVVVGGGDVAMDACRSALRMPGCKDVKVVYRRSPEEIPARKDELEGALKEGIEFVYNTQQVSVQASGNQLALRCVRTEAGPPDEDGRRRPVVVAASEWLQATKSCHNNLRPGIFQER